MRMHIITAALLLAPVALATTVAAQDSTQSKRDSTNTQTNQYNNNQYNRNYQDQQGPQSDEAIVMKIHRTNQMEIHAGQLAQRNGSSSKVKSFAARLVKDHQAADKKLTTVAKQMGVSLTRGDSGYAGHGYGKGRYGERGDSAQRGDSMSHPSDREGYPRTYGDSTQRNDSSYRQGYNYPQRGDSTMQGQGDSTRMGERDGRAQMWQLQNLHGAAFDTAFANAMVQGHERAISMLESVQNTVQSTQLKSFITSTLPTLRTHLQIAQSLSNNAATTSSSQDQ